MADSSQITSSLNVSSNASMINGVSRGSASLERQWSFGAISWTRVLRYQDWVNLLLTIGFVVGLLVADGAQKTYVRPFWIYDATISFPYK